MENLNWNFDSRNFGSFAKLVDKLKFSDNNKIKIFEKSVNPYHLC